MRADCWDRALHSFGTASIFERRATKVRTRLRALAGVALGIPLIVGALVLGFGIDTQALRWVVPIAAVLGVLQVAISLWALIAKWDDTLTHSLDSMVDNHRLSRGFEEIARHPTEDFAVRFQVLNAEYNFRDREDLKEVISDEERRRGMRAALRQFQRSCAGCGQVPRDMKRTDCGVCGHF
jgi:mobilome CxxCx(11)CxxC protein